MTRRKSSKPQPVHHGSTSPEVVENLKEAVGRLIARRVLREWQQNRQLRQAPQDPLAETNRTN